MRKNSHFLHKFQAQCFRSCFKLGVRAWRAEEEYYEVQKSPRNAHMDGFLLHLQNEQKEVITKEDPHLHIYSSNDVDIITSHLTFKETFSPIYNLLDGSYL
ncbi:hypothetical protein NE237_021364 [Protea cynaroides]|uniref:Uncharacterized protein n=1 Tax=Protea cynaroides TaxID=273540 RepID=A0A9Q0H8Z1_9MAGN|nr:hypothetical protein NE237_021364 [Protea cynaroides]